MKFKLDEFCPCCGYDTKDKEDRLNYTICKICFWEDDPLQLEEINEDGANYVSLIQGRKNFEKFGACEIEMINNVREVTEQDRRIPNYKVEL